MRDVHQASDITWAPRGAEYALTEQLQLLASPDYQLRSRPKKLDPLLRSVDPNATQPRYTPEMQIALAIADLDHSEVYPAAGQAVPFLTSIAVTNTNRDSQYSAISLLREVAYYISDSLMVLSPGSACHSAHKALSLELPNLSLLTEINCDHVTSDGRSVVEHLDELVDNITQPQPTCLFCGQRLASDAAQQCLHCSAKWHMPAT